MSEIQLITKRKNKVGSGNPANPNNHNFAS